MSLLMVRKSAPAHAADAAPKFRIGQEVIVKTKYTEPYRARIVGLWDMSKNGPYDEQGYLIKNIKGGVESMPEHALSLATAKDAQAAADASEVQRVEKLLKRELTDAEFWKLGDYVMKHMKVGKTFTDNELLSAVKDSAASVDSNAEEIVNHDRIPVDQLGGEANARKHGYIIAKKGGRVYGVHIDGYSDKLAKKTIEEAGYTVVGDAADSAAGSAQDRGNYATNSIALLKKAIDNLRTAYSVVSRAVSNIGDAMDKVKDERAKSSLKSMQQEWWECEREVWAALEKVERIPVPSGVGVPNRQKLSPEDRKFIEEFFG